MDKLIIKISDTEKEIQIMLDEMPDPEFCDDADYVIANHLNLAVRYLNYTQEALNAIGGY